MSLFDVLRYPISDHPTVEELEALPNKIYKKWILEETSGMGWIIPPAAAAGLISRSETEADRIKVVSRLRKLIFEYEPDNSVA